MKIIFIKPYISTFTLPRLKSLCKKNLIQGYYKLNKSELVDICIKYYAVLIIQRRFRKHITTNDICPFTLEKVKWPFWGKKTGKGFVYYNLQNLAEYFISTGVFKDPLTRELYSSKDLNSIENMIADHKIKLKKTLKFARNNKNYYRNIKDRDEQIDILMERVKYIFCVIRDKLEYIITGEENLNNLFISMDTVYMPDASSCLKILSNRCKKSLKIVFEDLRRIIDDIKFDCIVVNKVKYHMTDWVEDQEEKLL